MELLSPAGNRESLIAAVQNGADAVYFGGSMFNARHFADNFNDEALKDAIDYCHLHGVKAYITCNTLILDKEMQCALDYAAVLYRANADAVLVQDLGLAALLKKELPQLVLHASTQMAIHDQWGVKAAEKQGMTRVVLARETSLQEIKRIHENTKAELEAFVHGALCMSASGNCLFSSMMGERSGNRGTCAQPCRKRISVFGLPGETDYHLSLSDLCMLGHVGELEESGVCSLKIEGRMKRPEYVAAVTRAYRAAIDGADEDSLSRYQDELLRVFQRGGAHTGYFYGDDNQTDCVAQNTRDEELLSSLRASYTKDGKKQPVSLELWLIQNQNTVLRIQNDTQTVDIEKPAPQRAQKEQSEARFKEQLQKLGDTPFYAQSCSVHTDDVSFLAASELNQMRREACAALANKLCEPRQCEPCKLALAEGFTATGKTRVFVKLKNIEQMKAAFEAGADRVLLEPWNYEKLNTEDLLQWKERLLLALPAVIPTEEEHALILRLLGSGAFIGAEVNNLGQAAMLQCVDEAYTGLHMNVTNRYTVKTLKELGFESVMLSPELSKAQLRDILLLEGGTIQVYGRIPLMQLRHCPRKEHEGCANCKGNAGTLTDEAGRVFPLSNIKQGKTCLVRVLNSEIMDVIDAASALPCCNAWQLEFYDEDGDTVKERVNAAKSALLSNRVETKGTTRGHWNRPLQ